MNLIIFGPPGAGKGTQADYLVKKYNYLQLSSGDLLRNEIQNKTNIGNQISETIGRGELVTDSIVYSLLEKIIKEPNNKNRMIFDGYPRNISQAENLDKILRDNSQNIGSIIYLNVKRDEIKKRIEGRVTCIKCHKSFNKFFDSKKINNHDCGSENLVRRPDDNMDTIIRRFDTYTEVTKPVLKYYSSSTKFIEIDGSLKIEEISGKIDEIVKR